MKEVRIGVVGVDSGQLMICDPCYLRQYEDTEYSPDNRDPSKFSYDTVCRKTVGEPGYGQLDFQAGHPGLAVAFASGYGDGLYPVYATIENGRVMEVRIVMR